jgi:molecular chaperone Hsp33
MSDAIHRFLFEALDIRGALVQLDASWQSLQHGRNYPAPVRDLLGQLAAVTAVIAANLKSEQRMVFQLQGHGPVSLLVMDCQPQEQGPLHLRGMARGGWLQTHDEIAASPAPTFASDARFADLLGDGKLVLTLHQPDGQAYQSFVPLVGDSVAEVFEHFLAQSEQQPTRLFLMANEARACALFLQRLPNADERDADGWNRVTQLTATVRPDELALAPEALMTRLFSEEEVRLFGPRGVRWHCPRDEAKVRTLLTSLGRTEIEAMLSEKGRIDIEDEICGHRYEFGAEIVDELFPPERRTLH